MSDAVRERVAELAAGASLEVTPRQVSKLAELGRALPAGTTIYVTSLPGADLDDLVAASVEIRRRGHVPVPHLPARGIAGPGELDRLLGRLSSEAAVDDVLVIGGSLKEQAGEYGSSLDVLRSGLLERHGIVRAGVAGHPEGTPDIPSDAVVQALAEKNAFAQTSPIEFRIVTQFALAAAPYVTWEKQAREAGNRLPVHVGLPGVTSPATLIKYGLACGIGPSLEVLRKQTGGLLKLATTRVWKPDGIAEEIAAATLDDPASLIRAFHLFPFGGLDRTAEWLSTARGARAALPA